MSGRAYSLCIVAVLFLARAHAQNLADSDLAAPAHFDDPATTEPTPQGRYFFNLLDHRSQYNTGFFIDSFIGPQLDGGNQIEFDYLHGEKRGIHDDEVDADIELNPIGQLTLIAQLGWSSHNQPAPLANSENSQVSPQRDSGLENVDLAALHPIYQYVSPDKFIDYTAEVRLDVGIPTRGSSASQDFVVTPYLGHLLRLGDHISLEAWTGPQFTIAPHAANELNYGACIAYVMPHHSFPLPWTDRIAPQFELDGQIPLNSAASESLFAVAGFDLSLQQFRKAQPHLAIGYEFPVDQGARDQLRWAILVQMLVTF